MSIARTGARSRPRSETIGSTRTSIRARSWRRAGGALAALAVFWALPGAAVDPLIGPNFQVSDVFAIGVDRDAVHTAVAYNGTAGQYLVVWEADGLPDGSGAVNDDVDEIFGRIVDSVTGLPVGADFRISNTSDLGAGFDAANPAVVYNGTDNEYLVVWQGGAANRDEIFGQRLNAAGGELGSDFRISNASASAADRHAARPAVAYNAATNDYLAVWQDRDRTLGSDLIFGQRVAAAGALAGTEFAITASARRTANPAVAYNGIAGDFLVAWEGNADIVTAPAPGDEQIFAAVVPASGPVTATPGAVISDAPGREGARPDVAYNAVDNEYLAVWESGVGPEGSLGTEIFGRRVSAAGAALGGAFRISDGAAARAPALAHGGGNNQYLIVWQASGVAGLGTLQHEVFGRLVTGPGVLLGTADLRVSDTILTAGGTRDSANPAVVYDGAESLFLVGFEADGLPDPANDDITEIFAQFVEPLRPDLQLGKDDGAATTVPGGTVAYTLSYANLGGGSASGAVITETVPEHTTFNAGASTTGWACAPDGAAGATCTLAVGTVASGGSGTATFAVTVNGPLPAGVDEVANTASIADDGTGGADLDLTNNTAGDSTPVDAAPDLRITKDDGSLTAVPGDTIAYTLDYANIGSQDAVGVVITETVPSGTTFSAGSSTAGWSCGDGSAAGTSCTLSVGALGGGQGDAAVFAVAVDALIPAGLDAVTNAVSIADDGTNGADPNPTDNTAGDTTPVDATPDLQIAKDDGGVTAGPGATIVYALDFANIGNQGATGTTISETVPANTTFDAGSATAGWSCADGSPAGTLCTLSLGGLAAGDSGSARFAVAVDDPLPAGVGEIANTASIADDGANGPDPNLADNTGSDTTPVGTPDLQVAKDDDGIGAAPGDTVVYTLSYANVGDRDATGAVLTDLVPANTTFDAAASTPGWSCTPNGAAGAVCTLALGTLAAGDSGSAGFAITLDNPLPDTVVQIANTASIADDGANGPDANPADNTDGDTTPVLTPDEQTQALLEFVDDAVADGTLAGSGPGSSANGRLGALINKIDSARALIEAGDIDGACSELLSALRRTDGLSPPPDFVEGALADELAAEIRQLRTRLGCS